MQILVLTVFNQCYSRGVRPKCLVYSLGVQSSIINYSRGVRPKQSGCTVFNISNASAALWHSLNA
jgi:hypothetical protein